MHLLTYLLALFHTTIISLYR